MPRKTKIPEKAPNLCEECSRWKEGKGKMRISSILATALTKFEERLKNDDFKASVGDYLKLMEMEKEFESETAKEIKVSWVEPAVELSIEK
jgi:hypothetical protein